MNTRSNARPDSPVESQVIAPAVISPTRRLYWLVQRELWEYRWIYIAPVAVAVIVLAADLIGMTALPHHRLSRVMALDPVKRQAAIILPYDIAAGLIMATAFFLGLFYCLEALQSERRDRSILFWKSLPVSDLTTVLSKASIPLILTLLSFAITVATHFIMLLISTVVLLGSGLSLAPLWTQLSLSHRSAMLLYHLLTVHTLWYAPIYGWLLLVSAWARRTAFLWAILPPLVIGFVEKIAFNTNHFSNWLLYRFSGPEAFNLSASPGLSASAGGMSMTVWAVDSAKFFTTPGLWFGLIAAAAFLFAAARVRRYRGPI